MANIYVRSTDGSDSDNGSTWALAKATLAGASGIDTLGDTVYVSHQHAELSGSNQSLNFAAGVNPVTKILCVNDGAEPPTALATTAVVAVNGTNSIDIYGGMYVYGITFETGQGNSGYGAISLQTSDSLRTFEKCKFKFSGSSSVSSMELAGSNYGTRLKWIDCDWGGAGASYLLPNGLNFHWCGGSILSGWAGSKLFDDVGYTPSGAPASVLVENVDFTNAPQGFNFSSGIAPAARLVVRNCKLPSGWSGSLNTGTGESYHSWRAEMYNCDAGDTNYRLKIADGSGTIDSETTLVRSSGANDGTTPLSWKMVSYSYVHGLGRQLYSPEIALWNEATGASKTVTVEILHDSTTNLKDDEVWLELAYSGDSSSPKYSMAHDGKADVLATAADQTTSSATWTTTGLTNPNKQKLSVTFTPQNKGWFLARVVLAKASKTIYVDPLLTVA